jgi:hypothetical protein
MTLEKLPLNAKGHLFHRDNPSEAEVLRHDERCDIVIVLNPEFDCSLCGSHPSFDVHADRVDAKTECPYPEGIITRTTLSVPSGKIIVTDDLRPIYDSGNEWANPRGVLKEPPLASYNSILGQSQMIHEMAAMGCAYGPVLNTSPALYRTGPDDTYILGNFYSTDEEDYATDRYTPEGYVELAHICTGIWAYSIADFEDWRSRGGVMDDQQARNMTVVDVRPGVYQFIYHGGERGFDYHATNVTFAEITWIEEVG